MIVNADAAHLPLADRSIHCVVTSPPYWGLRDYGVAGQLGLERTPEEYVANLVAVFREVGRVLRDDGTCWINLGDSYAGSGPSGASYQSETTQRRQGLAADGAFRISKTLGERGLTYADKKPIPPPGLKPKDLVGIPWRVAFALQADGWYLRSDIIWSKPNPMPESVTDRPTKAHEYLFLLAKRERYYYDAEAIKEPSITGDPRRPYTSEGAWQLDGRPIEQRHGGKVRSPAGWKTGTGSHGSIHENGREPAVSYTERQFVSRNRRTVWEIATQPYPEAHFATFPEALVEPCVLAGCPAGGRVLDPFAGSGTVGQVCHRLGRRFVGCELKPAYCQMAATRTAQLGLL